MNDLTVDDLFAQEHIVLRFTPEELRGLYLLSFLALEGLCQRGVYGINWTDYNIALDALLALRERITSEVADQRSGAWRETWGEAQRQPR